jgi:hypothetical protein
MYRNKIALVDGIRTGQENVKKKALKIEIYLARLIFKICVLTLDKDSNIPSKLLYRQAYSHTNETNNIILQKPP